MSPPDRVLEVEQPAARYAVSPAEQHQVVDVIIAQHQGSGPGADGGKNLQPGVTVLAADVVAGGAAKHRRPCPVDEQRRLFQEHVVVVILQPRRHDALGVDPVQLDQYVDGKLVKTGLDRAAVPAPGVEDPGIGLIAQILEQQQAVLAVLGQDVRGAEAEGLQVPGDGDEGIDVLFRSRHVHQHRPPVAQGQPKVASERRIAGQRRPLGAVPALGGEEEIDQFGALSHRP